MAEGINVRFAGPLQRFIQSRTGSDGVYQSASEYIRDLVRHDYEREQQRLADSLYDELRSGLEAPLSEFEPLDIKRVISQAKKRRASK